MKLNVYIDNKCVNGSLFEEVKAIVEEAKPHERFMTVELFMVNADAESLPRNYQIVNFGSRETIVVCDDGQLITDAEGIAKWESEWC